MITDMFSNKKSNLVVTELFIRGRKLNIFLVFITQSFTKSYYEVRKQIEALKVLKTSRTSTKSKLIFQKNKFPKDLEKKFKN